MFRTRPFACILLVTMEKRSRIFTMSFASVYPLYVSICVGSEEHGVGRRPLEGCGFSAAPARFRPYSRSSPAYSWSVARRLLAARVTRAARR